MKSVSPMQCTITPSVAVVLNWNQMSPAFLASKVGNSRLASGMLKVTVLSNRSEKIKAISFKHAIHTTNLKKNPLKTIS